MRDSTSKASYRPPTRVRHAERGGRRPSASDTKTAPNPLPTPGTHTHARNRRGTHRAAVCRRRGAATSALLVVPLERRPRNRRGRHPRVRRRLRSAAPALRPTPAAALDPGQPPPPPPPPIWRRLGGGARRLGFGFWVAASAGRRRRRRRRRRDGMVVVVVRRGKGEGEESDRGGSAVNAMAAMARSLSLLRLLQVQLRAGRFGAVRGACSLRLLSLSVS